jgi:teichoic acid transport system ATP-binding protein
MAYKVKFKHVTKRYKMYNKPSEKILDLFSSKEQGEYHYALNNISFEVPEGEVVGIIGLNGSGKSTLSNLIAGVTMPNEGQIFTKGTAALIAIGSGLNPQLTGIENIEIKGLMLGLSKEKIKEITPKVMEFADIGKFIYQPVKTYSSGMKSRLGFAISIHIDPDIFVIDEALSVGDQTFTDKCLDKMNEFKENGKTIFFISHSLAQVKSFCTKAIWLHYGTIREYGDASEVVDHYMEFLRDFNKMTMEERRQLRESQIKEFQHGLLQNTPMPERKKRKRRKLPFLTLAAIAALGGAGATYAYKHNKSKVQERPASVVKQVVQQETEKQPPVVQEKITVKNMYVVNGTDVIIRKEPNKTSSPVMTTDLGEVYEVIQEKRDMEQNIVWKQLKLKDSTLGWMSVQWLTGYTTDRKALPDTTLNIFNKAMQEDYKITLLSLAKYFEKTEEQLKATYPVQLKQSKVSGEKNVVSSNLVAFTLWKDRVYNITLPALQLSISQAASLLEQPIVKNNGVTHILFETERYYVTITEAGQTKDTVRVSLTQK